MEIVVGEYNDRRVIWRGHSHVQYDGITVRLGSHYPTVSLEKFLARPREDLGVVEDEGE